MKKEVQGTVVRVYDGDTTVFDIEIWINQIVTTRVRFAACYCPELKDEAGTEIPAGVAAKKFAQKYLGIGKKVRLVVSVFDNYGRPLADVYPMYRGTEVHLNQLLIDKGFATKVPIQAQVIFDKRELKHQLKL